MLVNLRSITVVGALVALAFYLLINPPLGDGERIAERDQSKAIASDEPAKKNMANAIVRKDLESTLKAKATSGITAEWWESDEDIKDLSNQYAELFESYRIGTILDCERGKYGDQNLKNSEEYWHRHHRNLQPSREMFHGLSQAEAWTLAGLINTAGHRLEMNQGLASQELNGRQEQVYWEEMRNQALSYAPEFILNREFGEGWQEHTEMLQEVREVWIEIMKIAGPVYFELDLRQRCAAYLIPEISKSQVSLIAPGVSEFEVQMESLSMEFYDNVSWIIQDYKVATQ